MNKPIPHHSVVMLAKTEKGQAGAAGPGPARLPCLHIPNSTSKNALQSYPPVTPRVVYWSEKGSRFDDGNGSNFDLGAIDRARAEKLAYLKAAGFVAVVDETQVASPKFA